MIKEERISFPYMKAIHASWRDNTAPPPLWFSPESYSTNGIRTPRCWESPHTLVKLIHHPCNAYKALFHGLKKIESYLHWHIHLENYVLHPLVTRMEQEVERPRS